MPSYRLRTGEPIVCRSSAGRDSVNDPRHVCSDLGDECNGTVTVLPLVLISVRPQ
jgi:hypothetical protein